MYALPDDPARALKLYRTPDRAREAKVRSMVDAGLATGHPAVAFPASVVVDDRGAFAGFTMALAEGSVPIHELYSPASRRREFPRADWRFLVRAATNVAHAFGRVHAAGAVIGDVNGSGVLVSRRAIATLIDADSFQWGAAHPCRVGVPDFTPPELQGRSIDGVERTADHDGYGLAVLVFHLLFLGRHPSAGRPLGRDLPLHEAITQHVFPYSRIRRTNVVEPPNTVLLSDLPLGVANLFERAFAGVVARPSPREWVKELDRMESRLALCPRNPSHQRLGDETCPWCRIDGAVGTPTFAARPHQADRADPMGAPRPPAFLAEAMRFVSQARRASGEGVIPPGSSERTAEAPARRMAEERSGVAHPLDTAVDPKRAVTVHAAALRGVQAATDAWRTRIGAWQAATLVSAVANEIDRQIHAEALHAREIAGLPARLRSDAVLAELRRRPVSSAALPGIGAGMSARLAACGIASAADVSPTALEAVPRIGDRARTLLSLWRNDLVVSIERGIVVGPEAVSAEEGAMRRARRSKLAADAATLDGLVAAASDAISEVERRALLPDRALAAAGDELERAEAALRRLRLDPAGPAPSVRAATRTPMAASASGGASGCPVCGGPTVRRWARGGSKPNRFFLGCANYPVCTGSRPCRRGAP